jgi:hypothetical protein
VVAADAHLLGKPTATGVLDLETVPHGDATIVRDAAYSFEFPWAPKVEQVDSPIPDGGKLAGATVIGLAPDGARGVGVMMLPVPKSQPYDVKKGIAGARDGILGAIQATLLTEKVARLGPFSGKKITASAALGGTQYAIEVILAWDPGHHTMIGLYSLMPATKGVDRAPIDAFYASFQVKAGAAPPATLTESLPKKDAHGSGGVEISNARARVEDNRRKAGTKVVRVSFDATFTKKPNAQWFHVKANCQVGDKAFVDTDLVLDSLQEIRPNEAKSMEAAPFLSNGLSGAPTKCELTISLGGAIKPGAAVHTFTWTP